MLRNALEPKLLGADSVLKVTLSMLTCIFFYLALFQITRMVKTGLYNH